MDQFTVPKFIEHEPKIIGPFTFKQFIYVGIAGVLAFVLYFTVPFYFFILASAILALAAGALAFGKSGGRSLPGVLKNFFAFSISPKIYLWKKKMGPPPKLIKEVRPRPGEIKETPVPSVVGKSRLGELSTQIGTKIKEE